MGTKFNGGNRNDAAAWGDGILIGFSPGGREGVLCASGGSGGKASAGGGDVGEAKGFVMYEASEVMDGIGSRSPLLLDLRLLAPLPPLPLPGDLLEDRPV